MPLPRGMHAHPETPGLAQGAAAGKPILVLDGDVGYRYHDSNAW